MNARPLVILAHGTRAPGARPVLERVSAQVAALLPGVVVRHGYVEFQAPTARQAFSGLHDPVVVPFFLGGGYHVLHDLPGLLAEHGSGTATRHLGPEPAIVKVVADRLRWAAAGHGHGTAGLDGVVLAGSGSFRRRPVRETEQAAALLSQELGLPVRPAYLAKTSPAAHEAVASWRQEGARTIAVAPYLLAEGKFSRALHRSEAGFVAAPIGAHPAVARIVARRYREAVDSQLDSRLGSGVDFELGGEARGPADRHVVDCIPSS
ncbi:sirohydrochlorin cobaltochelatase [Actinomyces sp. 432]|uniref:sirohydrochlorin chelatase n=1 Tax=Actinomyces sp. 432 TaxID=2057798 RepID=UPI001373ACB0|nr:CbiX/SirB N-terminal domain-containing protein [Actinomyces sp. 432]QHO91309.1 sirohydrochlorin cobaltochelatase [Actinomyces sp. 432]